VEVGKSGHPFLSTFLPACVILSCLASIPPQFWALTCLYSHLPVSLPIVLTCCHLLPHLALCHLVLFSLVLPQFLPSANGNATLCLSFAFVCVSYMLLWLPLMPVCPLFVPVCLLFVFALIVLLQCPLFCVKCLLLCSYGNL
jgi:hypothetical protein